jgi:thymidylate synthase
MRTIRGDTFDDLLREALTMIITDGVALDPPPNRGSCRELQAVMLELTNPRARISRSSTRGKLFSAVGEFGWYLSGSKETDYITYYVPDYAQDDEDGIIHGGYGPRLRDYDGVDQLTEVINLLRRHPASRRAVIQLYGHEDWQGTHKDIPCTCTLQFLLRSEQVHLITYMRSNDAYLGLPHDTFCFTMIQEYVARAVGVDVGTYAHVVGSLHLYDKHVESARRFLDEGYMTTTSPMPAMPVGDPTAGLSALLEVERACRTTTAVPDVPSSPYWADLARLYVAYASKSGPRDALEATKDQMQAKCYDLFLQQMIDKIGD